MNPSREAGRFWTMEEEKQLIALRKRGVKWSQMRFHLTGRSTSSILGHMLAIARGNGPLAKEARDLKRTHRKGVPLVTEDVHKALELHAEGLTAKQIDERMGKGLGEARIRQFIREPAHFLERQHETRFTPEEDTLLVRLVLEKLRWTEIAKHFPSKSVRRLQSRWESVLRTKDAPSRTKTNKKDGFAWTRSEFEEMLSLYKEGKTTAAIAERVGRTITQVRWQLNSHGLVKRGRTYFDAQAAETVLQALGTDERVPLKLAEEMRRMAQSGMTVPQIALATHRKTSTVKYHLSHDGSSRQNSWSPDEEANVMRHFSEGKKPDQIAEEMGRSKMSVWHKIQMLKDAQNRRSDPPQKSRTSWTPEEETRLIELSLEGKTAKAIAAELGRSQHGVTARISENRKAGRLPMKAPRKARETLQSGEPSVEAATS
ncbi:hypothetical protein PRZ48_015100 [Zasmidium cellare]|uniref:Uncharacterized protein n=1 Tax=Zasmidium cellare TaxID=395010 RepID=A0ABR0DXN5_ZASCE|nr:hypothetical protein PRZ48_015100 [Zasmidium cellare]